MKKNEKSIVLIAAPTLVGNIALQDGEFEVETAIDGERVISVLEQKHEEIVMVVLDMDLSRVSGMDVLKRMSEKGLTAEIPVLVIASDENVEEKQMVYRLGAVDWVSLEQGAECLESRINNLLHFFKRQERTLYSVLAQNEKLAEEKRRLLNMDELTGCYNLPGFREYAAQVIRDYPERMYKIWYCDIQQFKLINDTLGYEKGDLVLKCWFRAVSECLKEGETLGRVAADRMVMLTYIKPGQEADGQLRAIGDRLDALLNEQGINYEVEIAAGVYQLSKEDCFAPNLNRMMDRAIVAQKSIKGTRGRICAVYSEELWKQKQRAARLSRELNGAIERGEIAIWLQPQYNYATGEMVGAEALCRWIHPQLGFISPGEFIPVLEQSGQISELDRFVWAEACRCIRKWKQENPDMNIALSVNVSRMDIREAGFLQHMEELLKDYEISPRMLRLEITESAYLDEPEQLIEAVKSLRDMGFVVEMDDFGSGYSSLNMLKEVPVDVMKLDMRFLSSSGSSAKGGNILSSVVRLSHSLELPVIAEGVETQEQANFLKNLGCNLMQGYWFAKPLPVPEFEKLLKAQMMGELPGCFRGSGIKKLDEVMDSESNSSYIFDSCIGGAMLLEYSGEALDAVMVNDAFYETAGVTRQRFEQCRRNIFLCMEKREQEQLKLILDKAIGEGVASYTGYRLQDGRVLAVRYRHVSSGEYSHVLFALVEDITETYELQQKLNKVTEEYYSHMELMPGGFLRYDADGKQQFTFVSSSMLDMLGYTLDEFMTKFNGCFPEMVYAEDRERVERELENEISAGRGTCCEYRIEKADGTLKWVYDVGRLVVDEEGHRWYYVVITDIDEHKDILREQLWKRHMT